MHLGPIYSPSHDQYRRIQCIRKFATKMPVTVMLAACILAVSGCSLQHEPKAAKVVDPDHCRLATPRWFTLQWGKQCHKPSMTGNDKHTPINLC